LGNETHLSTGYMQQTTLINIRLFIQA